MALSQRRTPGRSNDIFMYVFFYLEKQSERERGGGKERERGGRVYM